MSDEELESIQNITVERPYQRGQLVFSDGEEGLGFFLVVTGKVKVYKVSPEGKEKILHILGPGEPIGQMAVFAGESLSRSMAAILNCWTVTSSWPCPSMAAWGIFRAILPLFNYRSLTGLC